MKKYLYIPLALVLIGLGIWGCTVTRTRTLGSCLPEEAWSSVSCRELVLDLSAQEIQALMDDTVVSHRRECPDLDQGRLTLLIQAGGKTYLMELGEDGCIALADDSQPEKNRTCWHNAGATLYTRLSEHRVSYTNSR